MESLRDLESLGVRRSTLTQPRFLIEAITLHDQRVFFPAAHGITHETRIRVFLQLAAIHENAAKRKIGIKDRNESWSLNDVGPPARRERAKESARASREAFERRRVVPAEIFAVLFYDRLRPWL